MSDNKLMAGLNRLAEIAGVPAQARQQFFQEVQIAIAGAHRFARMNWSRAATRDISKLLKGIATDAQILAEKIKAIRKQAGKWDKEDFARMAFCGALHDKKLSISDALAAINDIQAISAKTIETISESADDAAKETIRPGRPRGTTARPLLMLSQRRFMTLHTKPAAS